MDCIQLRKRYDSLASDRHNIEGVWNLIQQFVVPYRGLFFKENSGESEIDWRRREIYDSTAVIACQNLAANIHSNITNPQARWFDMRFRKSFLNSVYEAKVWLEEVSEQVYLAHQESNFNQEINEMYLDLCSFGTSFLALEVNESLSGGFDSLDYECLPIFESYFESDTRGRILRYYRRLKWTYVQIVNKFGKENVPRTILERAESQSGATTRTTVIFAIYPREGIDEVQGIVEPKMRPYGWKYFWYETAEELGEEGGYYDMPVFGPRWRKTSGSKWGHSPAMVCISDVLTLQQLVELILNANEKVVDPPIITTRRNVISNIDLTPAGQTVVKSIDNFKSFESAARFDVSYLQKEQLQDSINRTFFMDQLQLKESPAMTATEVNVRFQLMQRLLGPTLGRLESDLYDVDIERSTKALFRYGMLPPMPDVVIENGAEIEIIYLGTMARMQKYDQVAAVERWIGDITASSDKLPDAIDIINADETFRDLGLSMGVPTKYMNSRTQIKQRRKQREQLQQIELALQTAQGAGEAMKSVGEGRQTLQ